MFEKGSLEDIFRRRFTTLLKQHPKIDTLFYKRIFKKNTAYVVGGFVRDIITGRDSRDVDVIVDVETDYLLSSIRELDINSEVNRHNGIKIKLNGISIDMWSLENNWAFKNKLVKLSELDRLHSIAKGCFYNYDALVIDLHTYKYNIKYFNEFKRNNLLNILQKRPAYKHLNPTIEANILRSFFLKKTYGCSFSANTKEYLIRKIVELKGKYDDIIERLCQIKERYPKYDSVLSRQEIEYYMDELIDNENLNFQYTLNL